MDLDRLLKLRLAVARFGEMDQAKWWNTKGQLGPLGAAALRRGFPRTHRFAAARSVFAVAGHRCAEIFDPPSSVNLWRLTESIEEEFDARWEHWLDHAAEWQPLFEQLERPAGKDLVALLKDLQVVTEQEIAVAKKLRRSAEGNSVQLPGHFSGSDEDVAILALAFARSDPGALAVPYARRGDR